MPVETLATKTQGTRLPPPSELPLGASVKYNPHLWGDAELRSIFVVRRQELETLLEAVRSTATGSVPQHILITGHRGMGKSTLLRRVALAVREDAQLSKDWLALSFPEEQYTVSNLTELWRNVLDALADALERQGAQQDELARLDATIAALEDVPAGAREAAALKLLGDCIARRGQRLLLLVDGTDLLLSGLGGGGSLHGDGKGGTGIAIRNAGATPLWRLRKTLSHEKGIFWLGASYQALEAQHQYQDAFHDFFRLVELRALSVAEMREALLALARTFGMGPGAAGEAAELEMARALDSKPERLRALRAMTGGNPRTTVMLYDLFAAGADGNVHNDLRGLLDMMTPLYKARMESLAEQPRKLLAHLMELWAPQTARDLADASGVAVNTVSSQLRRLETEGLVGKANIHAGKRSGYQVAERFFNVWYLMRYASRRLRQRLTWLVEFMRLWFSVDELATLAHVRASRHGESQLCDEAALEYSRALAAALPEGHRERYRLEWSVFSAAVNPTRETRETVSQLFDIEGDDKEFATAADYLARFRALDEQLSHCPHVAREEMGDWIAAFKAAVSLSLSEKEAIARTVGTLSDVEYRELRQILLEERRRFSKFIPEHATDVLFEAVRDGRFFPDCPDSKLAYAQILALFSDTPEALDLALRLLARQHADSWVERAYREATEMNGQNAGVWDGFGNLLQDRLRRYGEAESAYRRAIELDGAYAQPWNGLGNLLWRLGRYEEAEVAYRRAIELDEKHAYPWNGLGNLLASQLSRCEDAEAAYRRAVELDGRYAAPWNGLGNIKQYLARYEEAEAAYRRAIELDGKDAAPWNGLGNLMQCLKRYSESERAYRRAIQIDEAQAYAWNGLGSLLYDLKRYDEAEVAYRKAIELDADDPHPVVNLARLQVALHRPEDAARSYRKVATLVARAKRPGLFGVDLVMQSHLWLANRDAARQALDALARFAADGDQLAFFRLREQARECHEIGKGEALASLMEESAYADFLKPFSLGLRAAGAGGDGVLATAPPEIAALAQEVRAEITRTTKAPVLD